MKRTLSVTGRLSEVTSKSSLTSRTWLKGSVCPKVTPFSPPRVYFKSVTTSWSCQLTMNTLEGKTLAVISWTRALNGGRGSMGMGETAFFWRRTMGLIRWFSYHLQTWPNPVVNMDCTVQIISTEELRIRKVMPTVGLFLKGQRRGGGAPRIGYVKPVRLVGAS